MLNSNPYPLFGFVEPSQSFRWQSPTGFAVSVRLEKRGSTRYWYARKWANGKSHQEYICKQGELTEDVLQGAIDALETAVHASKAN